MRITWPIKRAQCVAKNLGQEQNDIGDTFALERPGIDLVCKRSSLVTRHVFSNKFLKQREQLMHWKALKVTKHVKGQNEQVES